MLTEKGSSMRSDASKRGACAECGRRVIEICHYGQRPKAALIAIGGARKETEGHQELCQPGWSSVCE
jgi:hypothetical protein